MGCDNEGCYSVLESSLLSRTDGRTFRRTDKQTDRRTDGRTDGQTYRRTVEQMDGRTDGRSNRWMDVGFKGVRQTGEEKWQTSVIPCLSNSLKPLVVPLSVCSSAESPLGPKGPSTLCRSQKFLVVNNCRNLEKGRKLIICFCWLSITQTRSSEGQTIKEISLFFMAAFEMFQNYFPICRTR